MRQKRYIVRGRRERFKFLCATKRQKLHRRHFYAPGAKNRMFHYATDTLSSKALVHS
uniref:Uncharacterized protein n=1 Tax=Anguilla anguilla TaxID=7936 RepID=A0A0E9RHT7_ANGAN